MNSTRLSGTTPFAPSAQTVTQIATDSDGKRYNGASKRCCADFNNGKQCRNVDEAGVCRFTHKCNQWVADQGPRGVCFGDHARCHGCNYDAALKLDKPLTK